MSAFKGTPGPWYVGVQNDLLYVIDKRPAASNDYPNHDAEVAAVAKVYSGSASEANARLIAASPLMYDYIKDRAELGDLEAAAIIREVSNA